MLCLIYFMNNAQTYKIFIFKETFIIVIVSWFVGYRHQNHHLSPLPSPLDRQFGPTSHHRLLPAGFSIRLNIRFQNYFWLSFVEMQLCISPLQTWLLEMHPEHLEMQGLSVAIYTGPSLHCHIADRGNIWWWGQTLQW